MAKSSLKASYLVLAFVVAWFGLGLQATVAVQVMWAEGLSTGAAFLKLLSYFTILTNGLVCLCLLGDLALGARIRSSQRWTWIRGGIAVSIVATGTCYELLLRQLPYLGTWDDLANTLMHDVNPALFLVYWLVCVPKGAITWRSPLVWLAYPAAYLPWAFLYGAVTGGYPYPCINAATLGVHQALVNTGKPFLIFGLIGFTLAGIDRLMVAPQGRRESVTAPADQPVDMLAGSLASD
jgi:hypothetical protein